MTKKYKRNFLTKVIFRMDYDAVNLGKLQDFFEIIKKDFPLREEIKGEEGYFDFNIKTKEFNQKANLISIYVFSNKKKLKSIKVHPKFLVIEYLEYKDSRELLRDIQLIGSFLDGFQIGVITRLGLRYINDIKIPGTDYLDWTQYVHKDLISVLGFVKNKEKVISRCMGQIIIKEGFGDINLNYGIWNENFPNEINEKKFILDFDAHSKFPIDSDGVDLTNLISQYNKKIEELFESVIKEPFRKILLK